MTELEKVKPKNEVKIMLNGKERTLRFGMQAFAKIEEEFGGMQGMVAALDGKPFSTFPRIIFYAIRGDGNDDITLDNIADLLDDNYSMGELKDMLMGAINNSLPTAKKGGSKNPPGAE